MTEKKIYGLSLIVFFLIRIFSFVFTPATPLWASNLVNTLFSLVILIIASYFLIKRSTYGWYIIAAEIILGGSGSYFGVGSISLRTLLLIFSIAIFLGLKLKDKKTNEIIGDRLFPIMALLVGWSFISALIGIKNGHTFGSVIADTIPYLFFAYYFPLKELIKNDTRFLTNAKSILIATLVGNFIIILNTFIGFSSNFFVLQDHYYHWYRDVAAGKITTLPFNFFRLVLNEHLLLVPILLWLLVELIEQKNKITNWILSIITILTLSINLTRIYYLALVGGILLLFHKEYWVKWFKYSAVFILTLIIGFSAIHLITSRGQSFGFEIFGLRLQSIATPQIEDSSFSRMLLLPKIKEKILATPIWGQGLGDTVTVYSPVLKQTVTTPNFDWGYLEIWAELGAIGLILWLALLSSLLKTLNFQSLPLLGSLLIINLTSPALFHVFGIILLVVLAAQSTIKNHASAE